MRKILLPFFALIILCCPIENACGQQYVDFESLQFKNDYERVNFENLAKGDTNYLALLMGASGRLDAPTANDYLQQIEELYQSLDSAKLMGKSPKKIVKTVFNTIHDNIFLKYEEENQFCEIFERGYYNCVSASAMYSYMLARLGVQHQIVETTNHVYVIAYPKGETWVIESTDPEQGFYEIDDSSREAYLQMLLDQKLITQEQIETGNIDAIIDDLNPSKSINLARLVSIQYQNQSIYEAEANRFWPAIQNHLKARYISPEGDYPGANYIFLSWIEKEQYSHPYFFKVLPWAFYTSSEEERKEMLNNIDYYGQQYNLGKLSEAHFNAFYDILDSVYRYNDSALKVVQEKRLLTTTFTAIQKGQVQSASKGARKLMDSTPDDFRHQSALLASLGLLIQNGSWTDQTVLDSIEYLDDRYPELLEFGLWRNLVAEIYLVEAVNEVNRKNLARAEKHLTKLDELLQGEVPEAVNEEIVALAFSKVAHYAYRRSEKKALYWVNQGLRYSPDSSLLLGLKDYYNKP